MIFQFDSSPQGLWNITELILFGLFIAFGFYFLSKYFKERKRNMESLNLLNIAYAIFFWATGINQMVYVIDAAKGDIFPFLYVLIGKGQILLYFFTEEISVVLYTQTLLLVLLFFISLVPMMYVLDKYLKNRNHLPVFRLSLFTMIFLVLPIFIWYFIVNRVRSPEETILLFEGCVNCWENYLLIIVSLFITIVLLILMWNFIIFYIILSIKSPKGPMKTKSIMIAFGTFLLYLGVFGGNLGMSGINNSYLRLIGPLIFFIGLIVLFIGFNKKG